MSGLVDLAERVGVLEAQVEGFAERVAALESQVRALHERLEAMTRGVDVSERATRGRVAGKVGA